MVFKTKLYIEEPRFRLFASKCTGCMVGLRLFFAAPSKQRSSFELLEHSLFGLLAGEESSCRDGLICERLMRV
jgi:hypothetical protein